MDFFGRKFFTQNQFKKSLNIGELAGNRIKKDFQEFKKNKPLGGIGGPINEDLKNWEITIPGPVDSPFEGGKFKIKIEIPDDYPNNPPKCRFLTKVFHPNINFKEGNICANFLKKAEGATDLYASWTNKKTICDVIVLLYGLLKKPNQDSPLNTNAHDLFEKDKNRYEQLAKSFTNKFAK